ncbi:unnamed protein product [Adineta ricciae]|uniref:Uncharacterized protein n=1 Tax=Adineta ricciae TaxID=249248 RepID=A0A813Z1S1_ADIRI|nr:unnamed protein product [Adineta ricciae]
MFRFLILVNLICFPVSCQTTEDTSIFIPEISTSQSWQQDTTEQPLIELGTDTAATHVWQQETTEQPLLELSTNTDATHSWQGQTTEEILVERNFTSTVTTTTTATSSTCPPSITPDMLEAAKREIIDSIYLAISRQVTGRLEAIEERLSALSCSSGSPSPPIQLAWQIYENLQIKLNGWLLVFDQPYSHRTRTEDLNQIAGICRNDVLVAASFNKTISVAAVGPAKILTLNTTWNRPEQFGQVYWYRTNGKSFGFSPLSTIRQTSGDNEDLSSSLRLSWILDQNTGGYRAGTTRLLTNDSIWRKVIYCN